MDTNRNFQADVQALPHGARVVLSGVIDERATFPKFDSSGKVMEVDMNSVRYMSSYGVRLWNEWMTTHNAAKQIILDRVPAVIVKQFNMFHGFLSANSYVRSLYAPFVHPTTLEDKQVLLVQGIHFSKNRVDLPTEQGSDGVVLEPDFVTENFFRFLQK